VAHGSIYEEAKKAWREARKQALAMAEEFDRAIMESGRTVERVTFQGEDWHGTIDGIDCNAKFGALSGGLGSYAKPNGKFTCTLGTRLGRSQAYPMPKAGWDYSKLVERLLDKRDKSAAEQARIDTRRENREAATRSVEQLIETLGVEAWAWPGKPYVRADPGNPGCVMVEFHGLSVGLAGRILEASKRELGYG
jgi:hypothetical protein